MLTAEELASLLSDLESDRVERTNSTSDTDKFAQAVCAFANDLPNNRRPGYLLIGVDNGGSPTGLRVSDQLLQNLGALRSDGNIQPLPALAVARHTLPGGDVAVVEVQPSDLPPVRYKGQVWIRVGPRKGIANEQEERLLSERRVSYARSFDASPCPEATLADLALGMFDGYRREAIAAEVVAANNRSVEEQLASLRFFDLKRDCPTMAGLLLFGKNPRFFLPGAYVQYLELPGTILAETPSDNAEIGGDLLSVLRELDTRLRAKITATLEPVSALREKHVADYPEWAVRELLLNAVMHRDYQSNTPVRFYWFEDRIEIQSPGGLYGEVTPETLTRRNSYRNPVVAEAMKALGYVNRFGYGIQRAQALLLEGGNPPAEFVFEDPRAVLVIIRKRPS
ncbi:MAG: ATP-binding protein [Acidobacteriota bacterium]